MTSLSFLGTDVVLFFLVGLLGGAHCIGMCGPLVTIYTKNMNATRADGGATVDRGNRRGHLTVYEVRQHALFNLGRTAGYTLIGAFMGLLGSVVFLGVGQIAATAELVRGVVGIGLGAIVILMGGNYLLGRVSAGLHLPGTEHVVARLTGWVERLASGPGIVGLGAVHGLLPCPILYPAFLYAFATGSALAGAVALAALGLGTIPAVFGYGTVIDTVDATHPRRLHQLLGVMFVVLGYVLLAHGLASVGIHVPHPRLPFWDALGLPAGVGGGGHH